MEIAALAAIYVLTARLGQQLAIPPGNITPIWIPSGVILAAVLWRGAWIWPGIFIGAFLGNVWAYFDSGSVHSIAAALLSGTMNGVGDTLCALLAAQLIVRFCGSTYPFYRVRCVLNFLLFGAVVGSLVSAVFGVTGLALNGFIGWDAYAGSFATWFVGDAVGIILVTPLIMAFVPGRGNRPGSKIEFSVLVFLVIVFSLADPHRLPGQFEHIVWYFNLPLLMWAARRLSSRATYFLLNLAAVTLYIWHFYNRDLHATQVALNHALIEIQVFITITAVTVLVITAVFRELQIARDQARDASRTKSQFLSTMSHEIRTPLNGVTGMLHLAMQQPLNDAQKHYLEVAQDSAGHLLAILNDVLDFSSIESGQMEYEDKPFTIAKLFERVRSVTGLKAQEKNIQLEFEIGAGVPSRVSGDVLRIGQIVINLVSNAVKFSESGSSVLVRAECEKLQRKTAWLQFSVQDSGIGMSRKELDNVFTAFRQADASTKRKYGGTGLGLAISRELSEALGGSIRAESEKGRGSVFYLSIPLNVPES